MAETYRIALLPGDGIGPDVTAEAVRVLRAVEEKIPELRFEMEEFSIGAGEFLKNGDPLPESIFTELPRFHATLLGAMGMPGVRWPDGKEMTPQVDLRERLGLYQGLRPTYLYHGADSPLKGRKANGQTRRAAGIAHVPEDRQALGLVMDFAAWENVGFGYHNAPEYQMNALFMDNAALKADTARKMATFDVRPPIPTLPAKSFSGGNQQKIVVAREIERNPDLLLVGQPTRGVDIGAIEFIHKQIVALRDAGKAVLLVSVELDEIMSLSDRILVMFDGKIMGERDPETTNERDLGLLMAGMTGSEAQGKET